MSRTLDRGASSAAASSSTGSGFGLASASALVVGSVIGTGMHTIKAVLVSSLT